MKEKIKLEKHELYKLIDCLPMPMITDEDLEKEIKEGRKIVLFGKERKVEQVPETWEDVKQLTKEHIEKLKLNKDVWEIDIQKDYIDIQKKYVTYRVRFTSIGNILFDAYLKIAENKTPNELWMFIKSLIGEE